MGSTSPCCSCGSASPDKQKEHDEQERKWRAEEDLRTLVSAENIKKDKERYKFAMTLAKEQRASLAKVTGEK